MWSLHVYLVPLWKIWSLYEPPLSSICIFVRFQPLLFHGFHSHCERKLTSIHLCANWVLVRCGQELCWHIANLRHQKAQLCPWPTHIWSKFYDTLFASTWWCINQIMCLQVFITHTWLPAWWGKTSSCSYKLDRTEEAKLNFKNISYTVDLMKLDSHEG